MSFVRRELVLVIVLTAAGVLGYLATRALAVSNSEIRRQDAAVWLADGRAALERGDADAALSALRHAARIDRGNREVAVSLAAALHAAGDDRQATGVLEALRTRQPDDAEVNLQLARLEQAGGDVAAASRHYQDALDALWPPDSASRERAIRAEFIDLLLRHGQRNRALSQTLVLAAELPPERDWRIRVGRFFMAAGDPRRAIDRFTAVLGEHRDDPDALAGAGEAAFELGDFATSRQLLARIPNIDPRLGALRAVADLVLAADPLAPRLSNAERTRRALGLIERSRSRLEACRPEGADAVSLRAQLDATWTTGRRDAAAATRDRAEDALGLASRVQRLTAACPDPQPMDRAIPLMARRHGIEDAQ